MIKDHVVRSAREGRIEAFRELYDRHRDMVYATVRRHLANVQDAEDAVQSAFSTAFLNISRFRNERGGGFPAWLRRIALRKAIDRLRTMRRRGEHLQIAFEDRRSGESDHFSPDPESDFVQKQIRDRIARACSVLSPQQTVIFNLRYNDHLPVRDIAARLGCSRSNVKIQSARALAKLRRQLFDLRRMP